MTIRPTINVASLLLRWVWMLIIIATIESGALANVSRLEATVANSADKVVITAKTPSSMRVGKIQSSAGKFLAFEFPGVLMSSGKFVSIRNGGVYNVKYGSLCEKPPASRIVVNTQFALQHDVEYSTDKKQVAITIWKRGAKSACQVGSPATSQSKDKTTLEPKHNENAITVPAIAALPKSKIEFTPKDSDTRIATDTNLVEKVAGFSEIIEPTAVIRASAKPAANSTAAIVKPVRVTEIPVLPNISKQSVAAVNQPDGRELGSDITKVEQTNPKWKNTPKQKTDERTAPETNTRGSARVSLSFHEADIKDVLKALAVQSGSNIVAGKDVAGQISVTLNNVSVNEALDYVTRMNGLAYQSENNTYLVAAKDSPVFNTTRVGTGQQLESTVSESVAIGDANAEDVLAVVKARFAEVTVVGAGQSVVLTGSSSRVAEASVAVSQLVKNLKTTKPLQKTAIYSAKYVKPSELAQTLMGVFPALTVAFGPSEGFNLTAPRSQGNPGAGMIPVGVTGLVPSDASKKTTTGKPTLTPETSSRVIIIMGSEQDVNLAVAMAGDLDIKSPQIKIEAKITSLTESGEKKLGMSWKWDALAYKESPERKWIRDPVGFGATLEALYTSGDAQLLASPSLIGLVGKPSTFFVGDEVTYIQRVETTPTGQNVVTDTKQVGVEMRAIGEINADGYITLNLHPEVSVLTLQVDPVARITLPMVSRRFTDLSVRVKDGETFIIGGLIRNEEQLDTKQVPGLGNIPFFGHLFSHRSKTNQRTEVVMIITASILKD